MIEHILVRIQYLYMEHKDNNKLLDHQKYILWNSHQLVSLELHSYILGIRFWVFYPLVTSESADASATHHKMLANLDLFSCIFHRNYAGRMMLHFYLVQALAVMLFYALPSMEVVLNTVALHRLAQGWLFLLTKYQLFLCNYFFWLIQEPSSMEYLLRYFSEPFIL